MSVKKRDFDRLVAKYNFEVRQSDHLHAWLVVDGRIVVRTRRSNGRGELPAVPLIQKQLHLNSREFTEAVSCTLTSDGYRQLLKKKGVL